MPPHPLPQEHARRGVQQGGAQELQGHPRRARRAAPSFWCGGRQRDPRIFFEKTGFYHKTGEYGTAADICPANSYCEAASKATAPCPANTASVAGSIAKAACKALAGFFGPAGTDGQPCPADSYCPAGAEQPVACPADTVSPAGSTSKAACVEKALYPDQCSPTAVTDLSSFAMCVFRSEVGLSSIPRMRSADNGKSRLYFVGRSAVPVVDMHDLKAFRSYVPATPSSNYAWAILGQAKITAAGAYKFCISSDDGCAPSTRPCSACRLWKPSCRLLKPSLSWWLLPQ